MKNICVIGGGAAGLMAAYAAAKNGHEVTLFEKNEKLGKQIYITGKGRCNFTNDIPPDEFLQNVVRGQKFLMGALYSFPSKKTIDFFEKENLDKAEFLIPDVVNDMISDQEITMKVLNTPSRWYGITYKEDLEDFKKAIQKMKDKNVYPNHLYGAEYIKN